MNVKITLPELSAMMADTTGFDAKACELFLRELFATIAETLVAGENVKVKGLGSFKSIEVEQRKSVNVNTGEQMIIPTHRKVTFTPDKALAEAVNAPFAMFEPVEINDSVTDEMLEQASTAEVSAPSESAVRSEVEKEREIITEIQDRDQVEEDDFAPEAQMIEPVKPAHVQSLPEPEHKAEPRPTEEPERVAEPASQLTYNDIEPEPTADPVTPYLYNDQQEDTAPARQQVSKEPAPMADDATAEKAAEVVLTEATHEKPIGSEQRHNSRFGRGFLTGALSAIALVAVLVLCWYLIAPTSLSALFSGPEQSAPTKAATVKAAKAKAEPAPEAVIPADTPKAESIQPTQEPEQLDVPTRPSDLDKSTEQTQTQNAAQPRYVMDKITKKRYLTTMARQYYGNYNLWPLIYDYNKGLGHPDRIRPGTKIKVPSAEELGINISDPAVLKRAKNRGREIYAKYR